MADRGTLRLQTRTISGAELRDRFQEATAERYARISVTDTGLGMEEGTKSRVFEPFSQLKSREKEPAWSFQWFTALSVTTAALST